MRALCAHGVPSIFPPQQRAPDSGVRAEKLSAQKRLLIVQLGEANKGLPVGLSQSVAHVTADAGLGLREEGAPPFDRTAAAEGFDSWAQGGDGRATLAEAEQRQCGVCLHDANRGWMCVDS